MVNKVQSLMIPGPAGDLESLLLEEGSATSDFFGIVCHPHPQHGGSMHNKVVTTLARTFAELGAPSIRFNYRGVEKSAGEYDRGDGETQDLLAVIKWVNQHYPSHKVWLAGFSFGSFIALRGASLLPDQVTQLITIAPSVKGYFDFIDGSRITCPWVLVMGEADELVAIEDVKQWVSDLPVPVEAVYFPKVGHFFHGNLIRLREQLLLLLR